MVPASLKRMREKKTISDYTEFTTDIIYLPVGLLYKKPLEI
jgi:hypothetical protein